MPEQTTHAIAATTTTMEPVPEMQDMSAGCVINFNEKKGRNGRSGAMPEEAFNVNAFILEFTTLCGPSLAAVAPAGVTLTATTDISLITVESTVTTTMVETPPVPAVYPQTLQFTTVSLMNLMTLQVDVRLRWISMCNIRVEICCFV